jgi:hypothetical protein
MEPPAAWKRSAKESGSQAGMRRPARLSRSRSSRPRFDSPLTRDPISYAGGLKLYPYCGNNPIGRVDPNTLELPYPVTAEVANIFNKLFGR